MKATLYGTRGSVPVCGKQYEQHGGNTTCLRIESECLPPGWALVTDAGSGFVPLSQQLYGEGIMNVAVLFTHYHHDHTQGLPLATHTHHPATTMRVWGPKEHNSGPLEELRRLMKAPVFPVPFEKVEHRFKCTPLNHIGTQVLVIHPKAGFHLLKVSAYHKYVYGDKQLPLGEAGRYDVSECLVIFMHKTEHPEYSVSFRFEEKPTSRACVFLTDHEKTAGLSKDLLRHVKGANLLLQDCQYSDKVYLERVNFGHGTPEYCADLMAAAKVERMGLTHHDPLATDVDIAKRVEEARIKATSLGIENADDRIFSCADYTTFEV